MRVFVAGASGAIGTRLVEQLTDAGHDVIGTHHSPSSAQRLRALGAKPVELDLLDVRAVRKAVLENEPEAIVHEATALANVKFGRNMDKVAAKTNELRTKGTDALLAAARDAHVRRFVAQSVAAFSRYAREGGPIKTEQDPVDPTPPKNMQQAAAAMTYLEQAVTDFGGIALRYGTFYGAADDGTLEPVRKRQFPIVGDGDGVWSWIHLDDAAGATVRALEQRRAGDIQRRRRRAGRGARMAAGARRVPRRQAAAEPAHLARASSRGEFVVVLSTEARGASNAKAKRELGWTLSHPSWRQGFTAAYASHEHSISHPSLSLEQATRSPA
jgi:nucleoside-diphosphate-sugar epimerase